MKKPYIKHLTVYCKHPGDYGPALGYCKYCRMKMFAKSSPEEIKAAYEKDQEQK